MTDSKFGPWGILGSLFLLTAGFVAYAIVPASVLPLLMAEFTLDRPTASASISAIFLTWALLQMPGGYVADRYDVRRLVSLGAGMFLLASVAGLLAFLGGPIRASERVTVSQFLAALRTRSILLVSVTSACTYTIWTFLVTWMPSYGTDVLGFDLAAAGAATALVPLAGIVARPAGGWVSELIGGRLSPVIATSFLTSILLLYVLSGASLPVTFAVLLALTGASVNLAVGLYLVYVDLLAGAATQGASLSVLITFSQIGNLVAPVVGGWTMERFSWTGGFGFVIGIAVLGLATIVAVSVTTRASASTPG